MNAGPPQSDYHICILKGVERFRTRVHSAVGNCLTVHNAAAFCFFQGDVLIFHLLSRFALPRCTTRRRFNGGISVPSATLAGDAVGTRRELL
ncbi:MULTISPECIES: hypothetical protein [Brucella]|uniref:Uncharacterized protein n=2 Tax=Brucella suis TaxID=29461 RepID=A0AAI8EA59_BRUSS|nr:MULTISPECIES: hypothetical protein [Brucella]AAN30983.1 hypothetical protein BR2093 [Brucella suis 1330]AEM19400.1 hypothetical protein BS1330_I2087 [Brucella suis 1330]AEU07070.1 hypothetical protein BSVBI22_A2089 [Brucella suis VBI22]AHN47674.1 hypothetical protein BSS2_I2027 [Brucella suis bv. 1 str. S2]ATN20523.1 hypothetical protein CRN66_12205 [Brucella canis]